MARQERVALIKKIEEKRSSKVICYITSDRPNANASVAKDAIPLFYEHLRRADKHDRVDVLLFTLGGDTLGAFGLARLVREFTPRVGVLIPEKCHSAGTLFALGANEIVMTRAGTLSPIDPSVAGPLNPVVEIGPGQRQLVALSVESVAGYKGLVIEDWDIKGEEALGAAFKILAERVHPLALGDVFRARQQIRLLATKLLKEHRSDDESIGRVIDTLTKGLGSHDYIISRKEARGLLGEQVAAENREIEDLVWELYRDFATEMELGVAYDPGMIIHAAKAAGAGSGPHSVCLRLATVESASGGDVCEKEFRVSETTLPMMPGLPPGLGGQKAIQQEQIRAGWKHYA